MTTPRHARARTLAEALLALFAAVGLAACDKGAPEPGPGALSAPPAGATTAASVQSTGVADAQPGPPPNLPAAPPISPAERTLVRAGAGCQVWQLNKPPRAIECPSSLEEGEVIRFERDATCNRSGVAGREGQVACPAVKELPRPTPAQAK